MFYSLVVIGVVLGGMFFLLVVASFKYVESLNSLSSYECGFMLMSGARMFFSCRFFLIALLFLIFDVEITLMLVVPYMFGGGVSLFIYLIFIYILLGGLIYEYYYGSLSWV